MSTNNRKFNPAVLIPIILLPVISFVAYIFLKQNPIQTQKERIEKIKQDSVALIPGKYEVEETEYEEPSKENDGCVPIYKIRPKEYSDQDMQYLNDAQLMYCKDINTAVLHDQTEDVRYNASEEKWIYGDNVKALEEKQYGNNTVATVALGGSHALSNYYIVRVKDTDELVVLSVPNSNRIRCEKYDESGAESMDKNCVAYRDSLSPVDGDWVPEKVYTGYYNDLLKMLPNINVTNANTEDVSEEDSYRQWLEKEADRIVSTYNFSGKEIKPLIQIPEYKFSANKNLYEKSYTLSSNDVVAVSCNKLNVEGVSSVYDIDSCNVSINKAKSFTAWSWTDNVKISPHITIFDNKNLKYPLIAVGENFGAGSRDDLSVYIIKDGKPVNLAFTAKGESKKTWYVDPYAKMYIENGKEYLVTYFHDPIMAEKSLTRIWEIGNSDLKLTKTILERDF